MAEKKVIDWDVIEPEWRAGIKSKLQLSEEFGVSRAAIDKHFAKAGITRDLSEKIRDKADALVTQDAVTREVTYETKIQEKEVIEANAVLQATIRREQRKDIQRSRKVVMSLMDELETMPEDLDLVKRTGVMKALSESLKTLVALEREAFGIASKFEDEVDKIIASDPMDAARRVAFILAQAINKGPA